MLSRSQTYHVPVGSQLQLDCEFHMEYFNVFNNPIVWIKTQANESAKINTLSIIDDPFIHSRRFDVSLFKQPPRYRVVLRIKGTLFDLHRLMSIYFFILFILYIVPCFNDVRAFRLLQGIHHGGRIQSYHSYYGPSCTYTRKALVYSIPTLLSQ